MKTEFKKTVLAKRYAQAFLNLFWDKLTSDDFEALCKVRSFFKDRKQACFLMNLAVLSFDLKYKALQTIRLDLGLSESFDTLFGLILEHKRSDLFKELFDALCKEVDKRKEKIIFMVTTVGSLSSQQKKEITEFLERKTKKTVLCRYQEDMNLIAGIRLQSEQFLWEASLQDRLNKIQRSLKG
jgi:ATP synthase F1 delta subunit